MTTDADGAQAFYADLVGWSRYAALLTGGYPKGDVLVRATLEAIVADPERIGRGDVRGALYRVFEETAQASPEEDEDARSPLPPADQWLA